MVLVGLGVLFLCAVIVAAVSKSHADDVDRSGAPSASAIGEGALRGGFYRGDEPGDARCVGTLFRESSLSNQILRHVASGDLAPGSSWRMSESDIGLMQGSVEFRLKEKCGVHPGP
ncbi:hypothetical protein EFK50_11235 [Nocardioides marmoriginsengisoli]|uniref:Uncharacterized protein n=2 Tax=Nocardioides marmoriginsengisoli TaxID=661483 RepID=A0A3N0CFW3_9ACTN|nr:hypothetical protein EFK50_11235 [Nocardioides marmoriginsengisoli]